MAAKTQSLSPVCAYLLWSLPSGVPTCFSAGGIITYFQLHSILTNKPNFRNDKMSANSFMTSIYEDLSRWLGKKTNPIQTQLKPIQSQFNKLPRRERTEY